MTKFIACLSGQYVNVDQITGFYLWENPEGWHVICYIIEIDEPDREWMISSNMSDEEEAQKWLDKFMEKHGLCLEPITPSRCF